MKTELIPIQSPNVPKLFLEDGLESILSRIETEARSLVPDVSSKKGRDAIASVAARISRSKTYLDNLGKEYVAELKSLPSKVDASRRAMRSRLDALKEEIRRPLTEYETAEKERLDRIMGIFERWDNVTASIKTFEDCNAARVIVHEGYDDSSFDEYSDEALLRRDAALYKIDAANRAIIIEAERIAKEEAERKAKEEAERKVREELIAKRAAEAARLEAELKAKEEAERIAKEEAAKLRAIEAELLKARAESVRGKAVPIPKADLFHSEDQEIFPEPATVSRDLVLNVKEEMVIDIMMAVHELSEPLAQSVVDAIIAGKVRRIRILK